MGHLILCHLLTSCEMIMIKDVWFMTVIMQSFVSLLRVLMLLTGLTAVSWCCSRKSWMCVCLLAESCVSRPVCVSMCSGGSIPSPYGQCVNLGWTALCVRQQECHRLRVPSHSHLYSLLFYIWSFYSSIWKNQGCIMDLTSSPGPQPPQP